METNFNSDQANTGKLIPVHDGSSLTKKRLLLSTVLVIVLPYLCLIPYLRYFGFDTSLPEIKAANFLVSRILLWFLLAGFIYYAYKIEKTKLLLWEERKHPVPIYIAFTFGTLFSVYLAVALVSVILRKLNLITEGSLQTITDIFAGRHLLIVFTCITAGVTEELLFRGFLQPRLELLFRNKAVAIIGSGLCFALIHFGYGTIQNVVGPFVIGILFAIHYSFFRNIKFLILFHMLWDVMAIYLALYLRQHTPPA